MRAYGVYLQDLSLGDGSAGCRLSVDASWLEAVGADGGVARTGGSLVSARFVTPTDGVFGAGGVVDAAGVVAAHVVIEPDVATPPAEETDGVVVPGDSVDKSPIDANPAAGEPTTVHGKSRAETRGHDNQDHGRQDGQAQACHRNNCGTPQDRRQQLDSRFCDAFPAGDSASSCRMSLLR